MGGEVRLEVREVGGAGVRLVEISGILNETFDGPASMEALARAPGPVVFDLAGVRRITSYGVRQWIEGLKRLDQLSYFFVRCRPSLVAQFNMIAGFGGHGQLVSLYLPYNCPRCGGDSEHLLDLRQHHAVALTGEVPERACQACDQPSEFDDEPTSYLSFAAEVPPPQVPPSVAAVIDGGGTAAIPLKVKKEITDHLTAVWLSGTVHENARFKRLVEGLEGTVVVIAQHVTGVTDIGLGRLLELLSQEEAELYLARATVDTAAAIAAQPARRTARVVSLWLMLRCETCGDTREAEIDAAGRAELARGLAPPCPRCAARRRVPAASDDQLRAALAAPLVPAPPAVAGYLATRAELPMEADSAGRLRRAPVSGGPPPDLTVDGYEVLKRIGMGGMAEVLLARQVGPQGFHKQVAMKRILPQLATDPAFVDMFLREARVAAQISHPNVVQIYDLRRAGGDYIIVMEYVPGWNLDELLKAADRTARPLPIELACRIASDMCAGLHGAHNATGLDGGRLAIVHRDVSPHNVLVSRAGAVKLTDFGIAKATNVAAVTKTDGLKGKFLYMAPERLHGTDSDERSDVFSAGMVLHVCLTGAHPFQRSSEYETWHTAMHAAVPPPSAARPETPPELDRVVARATARDLAARYQTAQELQLALEGFLTTFGRPATGAHLSRWIDELFTDPRAHAAVQQIELSPTAPGFTQRKP